MSSYKKAITGIIVLGLLIFTGFAVYKVNIKPLIASIYLYRGFTLERKDWDRSLGNYKKALEAQAYFNWDTTNIVAERLVLTLEKSRLNKWNTEQMLDLLGLLEEPLRSGGSSPNIRYLGSRDILGRIYTLKYLYRKNPEDLIKAEEVAREALAFNDENPIFLQLMAEVRMLQGKEDEAINFLKKRLAINNNFIKFYRSLGVLYLKVGDKQKGAIALKKSLELGCASGLCNLDFVLKLGRIYEDLGDWKGALEVYKEAEDFWGGRVLTAAGRTSLSHLYIALVNSYFKLGDKEKAQESAKKVLDIDPSLKYQIEEFLNVINQ